MRGRLGSDFNLAFVVLRCRRFPSSTLARLRQQPCRLAITGRIVIVRQQSGMAPVRRSQNGAGNHRAANSTANAASTSKASRLALSCIAASVDEAESDVLNFVRTRRKRLSPSKSHAATMRMDQKALSLPSYVSTSLRCEQGLIRARRSQSRQIIFCFVTKESTHRPASTILDRHTSLRPNAPQYRSWLGDWILNDVRWRDGRARRS